MSAFVHVTYIRTTPEKLWEALTAPEFTCKYWFGAVADRSRAHLAIVGDAAVGQHQLPRSARRPVAFVPGGVSNGWPRILANLKSLLETGTPLEGTSA
jgi:hypothetical protein